MDTQATYIPSINNYNSLRSHFTTDASNNGTLDNYKVTIGSIAAFGAIITTVSIVALSGLILISTAAAIKLGMIVLGVTITALSIYQLHNLRNMDRLKRFMHMNHSVERPPFPPEELLRITIGTYNHGDQNHLRPTFREIRVIKDQIDERITATINGVEVNYNREYFIHSNAFENAKIGTEVIIRIPNDGDERISLYNLNRLHICDHSFLPNISDAPRATNREINCFLGRNDLVINPVNRNWRRQRDSLLSNYTDFPETKKAHFDKIVKKFIERHQTLQTLDQNDTQTYHSDIADFLERATSVEGHCVDRSNTVFEDLFNDFVECDPSYLRNLEFPNLVKRWLYNYRKNIFEGILNDVQTRVAHGANTVNHYRKMLSNKYGLRNTLTSGFSLDEFASHEINGQPIERLIENAFARQYTVENIVNDLGNVFNDPASSTQNQTSSRGKLTTEKLVDWIKDAYDIDPTSEEGAEILLTKASNWKHSVMVLLLKDIEVLKI